MPSTVRFLGALPVVVGLLIPGSALRAWILGKEGLQHVRTITGKVGAGAGQSTMQFHALTKTDDTNVTMDGLTKGFQRIKLPAPMAAAVPYALRQWQQEATTETDEPGQFFGEKGRALQGLLRKSLTTSMTAPMCANQPERAMASWDNKDTLRLHLGSAYGAIIRQSSIFSHGPTPGAATADAAHTDMTPASIEVRVRRKAAEQLGCSPSDALQISGVEILVQGAREIGASKEDISDDAIRDLVERELLQSTRTWTSPNPMAKPLAFLDCATVDYKKYVNGDQFLTSFESGKGGIPDFTKVHSLPTFPKDKKLGQLQLRYQPDEGHKWYYFHDLAEDEAVIFSGATSFHQAFTPVEQLATEERVSAEFGLLSLVVNTTDQKSLKECKLRLNHSQ